MVDRIKFNATILLLALLWPTLSQACMFPYSQSDHAKQHDLFFTAKIQSCYTKENKTYIELSARRVWKGEDKRNYTAQIDFECNNYIKAGRNISLLADYTKNNEIIKIPPSSFCDHPIRRLNYSAFSIAQESIEMAYIGFPKVALEILLSGPQGEHATREPLYDYRTFGAFGAKLYYYINIFLLIGTITITLLSPLFVLLIIRKQLRKRKNDR